MKSIIETAIVALLVVLAGVMLATTRGTDETDWSKFKLDVRAKEDSFSYEIVDSEFNGSYENSTKHKTYCMLGKNPDGTYRLYFVKAIGQIKSVVLRVDNLSIDSENKGQFSMDGYTGASTVSFLNIELYPGQLRVFTGPTQAGSSELTGSYKRYGMITRFDLNDFYFAS